MPIASHTTALGQREQKKDRDLLYTAEEKKRRDETIWTLVQGVLAYVLALWINLFSEQQLMLLALVAYVAYFVNALQFLIKLRAARMQSAWEDAHA